MSRDPGEHAKHHMLELQSRTIKSKYRIIQTDNCGKQVGYLGNLEYESLWENCRGLVRWSMVIPCKGISQKAALELGVPTLQPISVHVTTDMPGKSLSVQVNYSCSVTLRHFRPLAIDLARMMSIKICLAPKDFWGRPIFKDPETQDFLIPRRPDTIDTFGVFEVIRQMVSCGETSKNIALFDVNSRLYFNCMLSESGKENIQTQIGEYECIRYQMISQQPDSGISATEYFYFCSTPPFCLIKHVRPSQLMEIVQLTQ